MDTIVKKNYYNLLFDYYGKLLTDKQQIIFQEYYGEDFSLSEIAEVHNVSRNAVYDTISKVLVILDEYETKLGLLKKDEQLNEIMNKYSDTPGCQELINKIKEME